MWGGVVVVWLKYGVREVFECGVWLKYGVREVWGGGEVEIWCEGGVGWWCG